MNNKTGEIKTAVALDRETEDTHTIIVIAEDGGLVPYKSEVTVHINVTDINDHRPMFDQRHYQAAVVEQQPAQAILNLAVSVAQGDGGSGRCTGKFSAFQLRGLRFKSRLTRVLNICVTFFPAKVDSAFQPYEVGKMGTSFCWGLTCDGLVLWFHPRGVNDSHPLNTTKTGNRHRLQWAT